MKNLLIILLEICCTKIALASRPSYDQMPINSQTWKEVDLTYTNTINGKEYTEYANLLRPNTWVKQNHLDKAGSIVHLTKEQLGIDIDVKVATIKPAKLNYSNTNHATDKPVIATFITHSDQVWAYIFKSQDGHTEIIQAVADHPFYSADRQEFIPIGQFKIGEHVKADSSNVLYLASKYQNSKKVKTVYNFEVYQKHNYKILKQHILAHNPTCPEELADLSLDRQEVTDWFNKYTNTYFKVISQRPFKVRVTLKLNKKFAARYPFYPLTDDKEDPSFLFKTIFTDDAINVTHAFKQSWEGIFINESRGTKVFANDALRYQYTRLIRKYPDQATKFPREFILRDISNSVTHDYLMANPEASTLNSTLLTGFLDTTPVGKFSNFVMDDFGFKPLSLGTSPGRSPDPSKEAFTVHINIIPKEYEFQ